MSSGWHREPLRHSNARKYGHAGGTYASKITLKGSRKMILPKKSGKIFDLEDVTDEQLSKLSGRQIKALEEGRILKSPEFLAEARENQVRDWEKRYELLAEGRAVAEKEELEQYRNDKANYLQYMNENARMEAYLESVKGTEDDVAMQRFGEELVMDLETENPSTVKFLRDNPDIQVYFIKQDDFEKFLVDSKGDSYAEARETDGLFDSLHKKVYVGIDYAKNPDGSYVMNQNDRAKSKETLVHEIAHAKNWKNFDEDFRNEWNTRMKPELRDRVKLFLRKWKMSEGEYEGKLFDLNEKWGGYFKHPSLEYNAYHYQGRVRRRVHRSYVEDVKELEKRGDYSLDNYRLADSSIIGLEYLENITFKDF